MSKTLESIKQQAAVDSLLSNGLNQSKAAKELGISRGGLRRLLSAYTGTTTGISSAVLSTIVSTL